MLTLLTAEAPVLNPNPIGTTAQLAAPMTNSQLTLRVPSGVGALLDPGAGNHYYLTIRSSSAVERVKVIARSGGLLTLEGRGADNTTPQAWPQGACLSVEWNPAQLCEFVQNCMEGGAAPTGVEAQTVCMASCACIDVGADGRITKITGGQSC